MRAKLMVSLCLSVLVLAGCDGNDASPTSNGSDEGGSAQGSFPFPSPSTAAPSAPTEEVFRFVAIGDFGVGAFAQHAVAKEMCNMRQQKPFDLVVTTGDNVYPSGESSAFEETFFEPYDCLLSNGVTFSASLGNHDVVIDDGAPEKNEPRFGIPDNNYVFRKEGVRFVFIDSNSLDPEWIEEAVRAQPGDRWTIAVFHHPVYSGGLNHGTTPGLATTLSPIFERHGVDLVLNGHDHVYSASREVQGLRYVVTGGGGATLGGCALPDPIEVCEQRFHFLVVEVGPREIKVEAIEPGGQVFHSFVTDGITVEPVG